MEHMKSIMGRTSQRRRSLSEQPPSLNNTQGQQPPPSRPPSYPRQQSQGPAPLQRRPHTDEYPPAIQADVVEVWEDDEDGTSGIRYGDWEADENEALVYQRSDVEFTAPINYRSPARELPTRLETHTRITHHQDEVLPAPPALPPASHRKTQPLNPQMIAAVSRREYLPPEQIVSEQAPIILPSMRSKTACPKCKGAGYLRSDVPFGDPAFGKPLACECKEAEKRLKRRQQLLELSDLDAFQNKSFANFSTHFSGIHRSVQEAFQEAHTFAQNPKGWLILIGPNGCGKTHLAAAIANQSLNHGSVVLFTVVPDFLAHLRATFAPGSTEAYDQRFSKMREAELLVLDDLGAHQGSPWASEKLFQLLNYRYNSGFPTVVTANKQGLDSIDERIRSRLCDTGLATTVVLNGALDYRRQNPRRESTR